MKFAFSLTCAPRRPLGWALLLLCFFSLASCANLAAVRTFAKSSAATAGYAQVVDDFVNSPRRQMETSLPDDTTRLSQQIAEREKLRPGLLQAQNVLTEYMSALGDVAADDFPNADQEIDALAKAIPATYIGDQTKTATSALARLISRAVLEEWRHRKVKELVDSADNHVQRVTSGLNTTFVAAASRSLQIEQEELRRFFTNAASSVQNPALQGVFERAAATTKNPELRRVFTDAAAAARNPDQARLALYLLKNQQRAVEARQRNLRAYGEALTKIATGHAYLKVHISEPNAKEVRKQLGQYAKDLQSIYTALATQKS